MIRRPLLAAAASLAAATLLAHPASARQFVYVSAAEDGVIDRFEMNPETGALTPLGETRAGTLVMPMALSPDKPLLYAVVRSPPLRVVSAGRMPLFA